MWCAFRDISTSAFKNILTFWPSKENELDEHGEFLSISFLSKVKVTLWPKDLCRTPLHQWCVYAFLCLLSESWKAEGLQPLEGLVSMFMLQRGSQKSGWPFAFLIWNVCLGWRSHPSLWLESPSSLCSWRAATAEFWLQRFQASWGPAGDESQTSSGAQIGSGWLRKDRNV